MRRTIATLAVITALSLASWATAATYSELGDAGQTLSASHALPGGTSTVVGIIGSDADLFQFFWGGGSFYVNSTGTAFDSQLFLFDDQGKGVWGNDDGVAFAGPAYLQDPALAAGTYYLAISAFDYDPYSPLGLMFQSYPYEPLYGPSNSGALSYWSGADYSSGAYSINFQQITFYGDEVGDSNPVGGTPVPEPGTILLLGSGLAGVARYARKKKA